MRSAILVIFSAIGLAGLFVGYWVLQPVNPASVKSGNRSVVPPLAKRSDASGSAIHAGENAWLRQTDNKGEISAEFNGDEYHPRPNGTIDVTNPVAVFYLANQQRLQITGKRGNIVVKEMPNPTKGGFGGGSASMSPPSKGRLNDVTVKLIDDSLPPDEKDTIIMKTNNAVFDNDTFIIYTEGYRDAEGHDIAADQVPVDITGKIRMKGRGLKLRWNDTDGRLELLEIAHGQILIVDPDAMRERDNPTKPVARNVTLGPRAPIPVMLAGRDQKSAGEVITSYRPPATQPKTGKSRATGSSGPVTYRASFFDNIRINQLDPSGAYDELLADNVDRMDVDFCLKSSGDKPVTTRPASQPAVQGTDMAVKSTEVPPLPAAAPNSSIDTAVAPTAQTPVAGDKEKAQPVYIRWTGLLRITPITSAPYVPLKPGEKAVKLVGAPVRVHRVDPNQTGSEETRSASLLYASAGDNVWLDVSPQNPQATIDRLPDPSQADQRVTHLVSTGRVQYSGAAHLARMTGPGNADVPLAQEPGNQPSELRAAWSKLAEFDFSAADAQGQSAVKAGHFQGDVDIEHPRFNLHSQLLDLQFGTSIKPPPPAAAKSQKNPSKPQTQTNLESLVATTGVNCEMIDADGKKKTIDADRLTLETALVDGRLYARHVVATGSPVHAYAEDDLKADHLDILLRPILPDPAIKKTPKQPKQDTDAQNTSVDLEEMVATGHVIAKSKDASTAIGDRMVVNGGKDKTHAILTSNSSAKVISAKGDLVTGPRIEFNSADGRAYIIGPGTLYSLHQESTTQPAEPIKVSWSTGAQFDGALNRIDADGSILVESTDRRGFVHNATGDHVRIDLRNKPPTTQPVLASSHVPATSTKTESKTGSKATPAKSDSIAGDVKMDLFKDKEVVATTLDGNAGMQSTLSAPGGMILQQMALDGPRIIMQQLAPDGTKALTVTVPAAGRMLVRDNHPAGASTAGDPQGQGTTVFTWQKSMVYNDAAHRADMDGAVRILHKDVAPAKDGSNSDVELNAEHVTYWFEQPPEKTAGGKSGTKPNTGAGGVAGGATGGPDDAHIQLKKFSAISGPNDFVVVIRGNDQMQARQVDYDPKLHLLTATGSPRNPVNFVSNGTINSQAEQMVWDTITWRARATGVILNASPATPAVQSPKPKPKPKPLPYRPGQRSNQQ